MALNDYEYQYRGLVFGGDTNYMVERERGIMDVETRVSDRDFPRSHGAISGQHYLAGKFIEIDLAAYGTTAAALAGRIESVFEAFSPAGHSEPSDDNDKLKFKYPGFGEMFIRCRPTRCSRVRTPGTAEVTPGYAPIAVQLYAYDPRRYVETMKDYEGMTGTFDVVNDGLADAYPWLTIVIPAGGTGILTNNTNGDVLTITGFPEASSTHCRMDRLSYGSRELIIYEILTDRYSRWQLPRLPFKLSPGTNSLTLTSGTNVRVRFWDTFG